ncbi:MAG: ABC transporter ATP-binding protein [Acidimicrobiaceae bacterium]|nr:ABC transporter ATP-binding protein [Acidimicrobiaceae bacterium]MXZ66963.1 ABC transporter ATP-binding protein [Acidimicrobiaceae bacterium]MYF33610.1 ABC transporter ATP-binding protein [Acidimicrobiaceae bacterium]MYG77581.1 ABC transporter ATP-binding protein [Acidimicrobiaceae bacterium]MYJ28589.1 ABC transporter ATP-binding protein [Acidimicrobiaceae bacterium]
MSPYREGIARRGYRLIMRSVRAHPVSHGLALIGALGFVATTVGTAWLLGWITDHVIIADETERTAPAVAAILVIGISVASGVSVLMRRWFLAMAELRTQRDWRRALLHRYIDLPMDFHRERDPGELLAHADSDVNTATMVLKPLAFAVSVVVLVIVTMVALFVAHPLLALIAAIVFPALALISRIYTRRVEAPSAEVQRRVGEVSEVAHESFDGAVVVKTLGREPMEVERMRVASQRLRDERIRVGRMRAAFEPAIDALPTVGAIALLLVGAWLVGRGSATPGDLVLAATLFSLLALPLFIVGFFLEEMPRSVVSLERVDRVLERPVPAPPAAGPRMLPEGPLDLEIEDLAVGYGSRLVLDGVSLHVQPGETVALVGATGSGKSTLLETVAGLNDLARGSIRLSGTDLGNLGSGELHEAVALVFQEAFLFADSVVENVDMKRGRGPADVTGALRSAAAGAFVEALPDGGATVVGERGVTLSGGQRQRVALARALVRAPRLLMLDDATSAVDPVVESEILANLRNGLDTTLLVVAHRISTIELADRVAYLAGGRIAATGTHEELLALDDYRSLVSAYEQAAAPEAQRVGGDSR